MKLNPHYKIACIIACLFLMFKILHAQYNFDWRFAAGFSYGMYLLMGIVAFLSKNEFLKKILLFGLVAGFTELISDWWLVDYQHSLVYPLNEPLIWASPLYMPVSWAVIFLQIGLASYFIFEKKNLKLAVIVAVILGGSFIPFFEYWAKLEAWWYYQNCKMIAESVPYYIIISEALVCAVLPFIFIQLNKRNYGFSIAAGVFQGLWIWVTCMLAFYLTK